MWWRVLKEDIAEYWGLGFTDAGSPAMEEIVIFHDEVMFILMIIIFFVLWIMFRSLTTRFYHRYLFEGVLIEVIWTLLPAVVLVFIAFPSLKLLYLMDEVINPALTIKVVGHQWY